MKVKHKTRRAILAVVTLAGVVLVASVCSPQEGLPSRQDAAAQNAELHDRLAELQSDLERVTAHRDRLSEQVQELMATDAAKRVTELEAELRIAHAKIVDLERIVETLRGDQPAPVASASNEPTRPTANIVMLAQLFDRRQFDALQERLDANCLSTIDNTYEGNDAFRQVQAEYASRANVAFAVVSETVEWYFDRRLVDGEDVYKFARIELHRVWNETSVNMWECLAQ